jgi:hypothetical protein
MRNIQMLMIDEGSQLLAVDAIHAIEWLDPERGRLVVAGDHLQLGPVISGDYPASEHGVDPTGSIMKNLMRTRDNAPVSLQWVEGGGATMDIGPCTSQLQENFRMVMAHPQGQEAWAALFADINRAHFFFSPFPLHI